ncbi:MAG: hypothetical protein SGPRY_012700 [Prymnesium sp.]
MVLAWYVVKQHRCCVLTLDYLPHHGVRSPDGSHASSRSPDWPARDLGESEQPWAAACWEATLHTISSDLSHAVEIALSAPAPGASSSLQASLHASQEKPRHRLFPSPRPRGRLVDPRRVAFYGLGVGGTVSLPFLRQAKGTIAAAALSMCGAHFPEVACFKQATTQGVEHIQLDVPGTSPSPPADALQARLLDDAASVCCSVHMSASENDPSTPIETARQLYDALGAHDKELEVLPGARDMTVEDLQSQLNWLMQRLDVGSKDRS